MWGSLLGEACGCWELRCGKVLRWWECEGGETSIVIHS